MKYLSLITVQAILLLYFFSGCNSSQDISGNVSGKDSNYYVFERYDRNGNFYGMSEELANPTKEFRYDCPICDGMGVIISNENSKYPVRIPCQRCGGLGWLIIK
jgi:hypothetical protein